jgi:signal transduction histidine kinase
MGRFCVNARLLLLRPYALAALIVLLAAGAKALVQPYISTSPPFILFIVAIMFTSWRWGFLPGCFATLLSAVIIDYWLMPPAFSFSLQASDLGTLVIFASVGIAIAYFIDRQEAARRQAVSLEEQLRRHKRDLESQLFTGEQKLRDLAGELALTEDRERRALASELHDYLTQLLTLGHIKLKLAQQFVSASPGQSERYMQETADALQRSLDYARTLMAELVPPDLHESGLIAGIRWLAGHMGKHGLAVDLRFDAEFVDVRQDEAILVYKCVRELLINVVKHGAVSRATVAVTLDPHRRLLVSVQDRGRGYNPDKITPVDGHFGLASIRVRLGAMGGWLKEESAVGKGTTITLGLPVEPLSAETPLRAASAALGDRVQGTPTESADQERLPFGKSM